MHGIFSNSEDCWTSQDGIYWPELLKEDKRFGDPSVYLGGYYTDFSSGLYRISDAANELLSYLRVRDPDGRSPALERSNIVFVAHSTGGLVVRYLIERNQDLFKEKNVGVVLLASPSRGSAWSNRLKWLRELFGNKMAGQLARDNDFIMDLDARFADLVSQKKLPGLVGIDAFENKFIIPGIIFNDTHVVTAQDSASYFGSYKIIPKSDHFSIAKPNSHSHPSHQLLWDFYETTYRPLTLKIGKLSFSGKLKELLNDNHTESQIASYLLQQPNLLKHAFESRWVGDITLLPNLSVSDTTFDFVVIRVEGPYSNAGDGVTYVRLMSPNSNPIEESLLNTRKKIGEFLASRDSMQELYASLNKREDFRGHAPSYTREKALIFAGRRDSLTKKEIELLKEKNNEMVYGDIQLLTYDSLVEKIEGIEGLFISKQRVNDQRHVVQND